MFIFKPRKLHWVPLTNTFSVGNPEHCLVCFRAASSKKVCGVCGCSFATRQGLSSHARLHLRHLGVPLSECTNGPIALLYELKESKGSQLDFTLDPKTPMVPPGHEVQSHSKTLFEELPAPKDPLLGSLTGGTSGVAAALPLVSPHKRTESRDVEAQSSSSKQTTLKPMWAPQDTDAPLSLGRSPL